MPRATREHHRPAWRTNRSDHRAHGVAMRKRHAPFDQRIEIRRLKHWGAERMRSIWTMIVGMDVENVRLARM